MESNLQKKKTLMKQLEFSKSLSTVYASSIENDAEVNYIAE
jgi:hypothetical protein